MPETSVDEDSNLLSFEQEVRGTWEGTCTNLPALDPISYELRPKS